jgi:hypothetical protein
MPLFRSLACLPLAGLTALLSSCATGPPDAADADVLDAPLEPAAMSYDDRPPPSGLNGLRPACFWAAGAQQALRTLGAAALDQGGGTLPSIPTSSIPEDCREVLQDTVECALPAGESLLDPVTGVSYEGWWGLASTWMTGALSTSGRRYVTACLVQRLNADGDHVPILLEGPDAAITHDPELAESYSVVESTAFGDLFSSTTALGGILPAFNAYVCWEGLVPQGCGLLGLPILEARICDNLPLCGLVNLGPCALSCTPDGPYNKCRPGLLSPSWTQTVRVRLEPETCQ